jgi:hypothetical protein
MISETLDYDVMTRPSRMVRPKTDGIKLSREQRPVDYGHCSMLLVEKYGRERGEKSYEDIALNGTNAIWTVASEIQKEKIRMLQDLKMDVPQDLGEYNWFQLWQEWRAKDLHKAGKVLV